MELYALRAAHRRPVPRGACDGRNTAQKLRRNDRALRPAAQEAKHAYRSSYDQPRCSAAVTACSTCRCRVPVDMHSKPARQRRDTWSRSTTPISTTSSQGGFNPVAAMAEAGEIERSILLGRCAARRRAPSLPFADGTFDRVITSEVLEHIQSDVGAHRRARARAEAGRHDSPCTVPSVVDRRRSTGCSATSTTPRRAVGGHVRIYSRHRAEGQAALAPASRCTGSHHAHALHSPYWWLKCAVGPRREDSKSRSTRTSKLLEWEIIKQPGRHALAGAHLCPRFSARAHRVRHQTRVHQRRARCRAACPMLPDCRASSDRGSVRDGGVDRRACSSTRG